MAEFETVAPGKGADESSPFQEAVQNRKRNTIAMVEDALSTGATALAFQPVVRADGSARPAYHEGLIRIHDPKGRLIPAGDFIHTVETLELGRQIDCRALQLGFLALAETPTLRLAVNMSARSIGYQRWIHTLNHGLSNDPSAAGRLILEITEASAMLMPDLVTAFMKDMQYRGLSFALDDFGAGATSFRYFRDFSFDILKIDGQFIRGLPANADNQVLTQALIHLGKQFDMFTVAESVEDAETARFLTGAGVDCMQGYHFGAPTISPPWRSQGRSLSA